MSSLCAVEQYREHNPYAKQYETTVQHTGRERLVGSSIEALGTNVRNTFRVAVSQSSNAAKNFFSQNLKILESRHFKVLTPSEADLLASTRLTQPSTLLLKALHPSFPMLHC